MTASPGGTAAPRPPSEEQLAEQLWDAGLRAEVAGRVANGFVPSDPDALLGWCSYQLADGVVLWFHLGRV